MPGKVKITSKAFGIHSANAREAADRISRELTAAVEDATEAAMLEITQKIKDEALRLTPVDTGQLRSAAYAKVEPGEDGVVRGRVGYDLTLTRPHTQSSSMNGPSLQHEPPTTSKFLVKAAENVRDEIPEIVKRHAKERLP